MARRLVTLRPPGPQLTSVTTSEHSSVPLDPTEPEEAPDPDDWPDDVADDWPDDVPDPLDTPEPEDVWLLPEPELVWLPPDEPSLPPEEPPEPEVSLPALEPDDRLDEPGPVDEPDEDDWPDDETPGEPLEDCELAREPLLEPDNDALLDAKD